MLVARLYHQPVPPGLTRCVPDEVLAPGQPGQLEDRLLRPRQQDLVGRRLRADASPLRPTGGRSGWCGRVPSAPAATRPAARELRRLARAVLLAGIAGSEADAGRGRPGAVRRTCFVRTGACTWRRSTHRSLHRSCGRSGRARRGRRSRTSPGTPLANVNGRRVRPGVSVSTSSAASPRCRLSGVPVRTRTKQSCRTMTVAGPHLLAVDDDPVAFEHTPGAQSGEVAPGVRLGERLRPGFFAGQETGEEGLGQCGRVHGAEQERSPQSTSRCREARARRGTARRSTWRDASGLLRARRATRAIRPASTRPPTATGTAPGRRRWGPRSTMDCLEPGRRVPRASDGNSVR